MAIADQVKECGVVGAGGAGFPTHVKLGARADTVIVNGVECEPLLASDKHLMEAESSKIASGLEIVMQSCGAKSGYIALKKKHGRLIEAMRDAVKGKANIEVFPVDDFYPAGDELVLVHEVTGRVVPEGGIPPQVECLVDNVETVLNVHEAVVGGRPVTRRYLTCAGEVKRPSIVKAHIGTSVGEILSLCGGPTVEDFVFVVGGPLMGNVATDLDLPVTKTTNGIIVLPRCHALVRRKTVPIEVMLKLSRAACCQCTYCTDLCPRALLGHGIEPHRIMRQVNYGIDFPPAAAESAALCSGCGLCEVYACVMGISPCAVNKVIKNRFASAGVKPSFGKKTIAPSPMAAYRRIPSGRIAERLGIGRYAERGLWGFIETSPARVEIPLRQHVGEPAVPVVRKGERVGEGSLLAAVPGGKTGAPVHASIGGTVLLVDEERVIIGRSG